ncbi:hypothetical protein B0J14DRAFT_603221 [Halenospora varia]|nr:hypothetical protein B0J14DRAFT_603221 [Halenospora varia]
MLKNTAAQSTENLNALGNPEDADKKEDLVATEHKVERDEDCTEMLQTTDLTASQDISARNIDPMKLITFLRVRFGIGRYEITRIPNFYKIRTPRLLSAEEIATCGWH